MVSPMIVPHLVLWEGMDAVLSMKKLQGIKWAFFGIDCGWESQIARTEHNWSLQ